MNVRSAPSITRVHTLHRIRTVVNHVTYLVDKGTTVVDDLAIAEHLIKMHLSKATTKKLRDQIGRRARDHLETARYLGFLYRKKSGAKFTHIPTGWGRGLTKYKIQQECPSDPKEEAIFVDRICRFKLTNASYLQGGSGPYSKFRSRPCLNLLSSLKNSGGLNIYQIGYILASRSLDVKVALTKLEKAVNKTMSPEYQHSYIDKLNSKDRNNIKRDTLPFVDWCVQFGLVEKLEESDHIEITERGALVLDFYAKSMPVWWPDLGYWAELAAAAILLANYLKFRKQGRILRKLMKINGRSGLFKGKVGNVLREVTGCSVKKICTGDLWFDFSLSYDVPPERWIHVEQTLQELAKKLAIKKTKMTTVLDVVEFNSIRLLQKRFKEEADKASYSVSNQLKIKATVPTVSIQYQWKSDYEAVTYILLKQLQKYNFSVAKYQSQLTEYFVDDPYWINVASNNPDLLVTDGFLSLVECKSIKEWGPKLVLTKPVVAELLMYSKYAQALTKEAKVAGKCLAVFSYEGEVDDKSRSEIERFLSDQCPCVVIVLRAALQKAMVDTSVKKNIRGLVAQVRGFRRLSNRIIG